VSYPEEQVSYPEEQVSYPEEDVSYPEEQVSYPEEQVSYPEEEVSYPEEQVSYPEEEVSYPVEEVKPLREEDPTSWDSRLKDPIERQAIFQALKMRLKEPVSYPGREIDQADFDSIDGPVLSYLEDVQANIGNHFLAREPEGWYVREGPFAPAYEGGTTTDAIKSYHEAKRLAARDARLDKIEQEGGDVAFAIYREWSDKWSEQLRIAIKDEEKFRSYLKAKLGEDAFMDGWMRFMNGVEYNDETWLNALGDHYRTLYFEVQQAEYMVTTDPVTVLMLVRFSVNAGKRPTDADFDEFVEIAAKEVEFRNMIGMAFSMGRGSLRGPSTARFRQQAGRSGAPKTPPPTRTTPQIRPPVGRSGGVGAVPSSTAPIKPGGPGVSVPAPPSSGGPTSTGTGGQVPGRVQTRINIRIRPLRTGGAPGRASPKGKGMDYAWRKHGGSGPTSKSQFSISRTEVETIIQNKSVVSSPVRQVNSGSYVREVDVGQLTSGRPIGHMPGGSPTTVVTVITDGWGNLVNTFPGTLGYRASL